MFVFWPCDSTHCPFLQYHFNTPSCQIRTQRVTRMEVSKQTGPTEIVFDSIRIKKPWHKKLHDQRCSKMQVDIGDGDS